MHNLGIRKAPTLVVRRGVRKRNINLAIVFANNLYASFGPGTVNISRKMVCLPEDTWRNEKEGKDKSHLPDNLYHSKQSTLRFYDIIIIVI